MYAIQVRACKHHFMQVEDQMFYELREPILLAACWISLRTQVKSEMRPYVDIYVRLASVCDLFYEVVRDKRFRRIIKRTLKGLSYFAEC